MIFNKVSPTELHTAARYKSLLSSIRVGALICLSMIAFSVATSPAFAQAGGAGTGTGAPPAGPDTSTPGTSSGAGTTSPSYTIQADDMIEISVIDHPEANKTYSVPAEGTIDIAYANSVINVLNPPTTIGQLKEKLIKLFGKQFYNPKVIISVTRSTQYVNVVGVTKNGKVALKKGERLIEVIAFSGGLPTDRPELYKATIIRGDTVIKIDVPGLYHDDPTQNPVLLPDDTIYIEQKDTPQTTVEVIGEVLKPGPILLPRDPSIVEILDLAGGPTQLAALSKATLVRDGSVIPIDLVKYKTPGFDPGQKIMAGDKLVIPTNKNLYYIFGPLAKSGAQLYPDDKTLTVFTAIGESGTVQGVELKKTKLIRPLPDGKTQVTIINVEAMLKTGDLSADVPIRPGDSLYIPPTGKPRGLSFLDVLGIVTAIGSAYFVIQQIRGK